MKKSNSDRLKALKRVSREIRRVKFVPLERPQVPSGAQPTLELLDWATRLYCYSILSHFRELLTSLVFLSEAERGPAVFIIARSLYEIAAHSYYVQKHIKQYREVKNIERGWKFMESINMGSLYMKKKGISVLSSRRPFPEPRNIGKIIRCFDEWRLIPRQRHASETYSYLSEFAHPNMAAFNHYYKMATSAPRKILANFVDPPCDVDQQPLAEVSIAVAATLYNLSDLLGMLGNNTLREKLNASLSALIGKRK